MLLIQKPYGLGEKAVCKSGSPCLDAPREGEIDVHCAFGTDHPHAHEIRVYGLQN